MRELLDIGGDVPHVNNSQEALLSIRDKNESVSSKNPFKDELLLNDRLVAYWTNDPTYAA